MSLFKPFSFQFTTFYGDKAILVNATQLRYQPEPPLRPLPRPGLSRPNRKSTLRPDSLTRAADGGRVTTTMQSNNQRRPAAAEPRQFGQIGGPRCRALNPLPPSRSRNGSVRSRTCCPSR